MHSFVARLRARAISQSTTISTQSEEPPPHTPDTPTFGHPVQSASESTSVHQAPIDRKILPQVHELLDSYSTEENTNQGLNPRPVKERSPVQHTPLWEESPESESSRPDDRSDSPATTSQRSLRLGRGSFSRLSQRLASSGPWATFGRMKDPSTPRLSQLEHPPSSRRFYTGSVDTFAIPRRSRSSRSVAAYTADSSVSVDHLRRPSRASEASSWMHPQSIISSHRRSFSLSAIHQDMDEPVVQPATPSSPPTSSSGKESAKPSITARSSFSTQSQVVSVHTPVLQASDDITTASSPRTFGQPSPPLRLSAFVTPAASPPLLPPFEHTDILQPPVHHPQESKLPETLDSSRYRRTLRDRSNTVTTPLRHWTSSLHAKTFPPRKRGKSVGCSPDENLIPFPSTSGRRLRNYASMPGVRHLFEQQPPSRASISQRESSKSSRRASADWNARQATSGVLSGATGDYGWPAEVSEEMIRISLSSQLPQARDKATGGKAGTRRRETRGSANADITQRVHNVPRSSDDVAGRPCSPLFSLNSPPQSIEGMSTIVFFSSFKVERTSFAGTAESGDKSSWPHPQDIFLESFKSGGVVEGKSSMSVRNGVPLSTLKEDIDDVRQSETLPRAATGTRGYRKSILRQSSSLDAQGPEAGPSSLHHGLFVAPTASRRSSLRRPARHASEPTLTKVPETPTKKGKRKAEDIDLTPPDPRTSHHATFLIPTDHRREFKAWVYRVDSNQVGLHRYSSSIRTFSCSLVCD